MPTNEEAGWNEKTNNEVREGGSCLGSKMHLAEDTEGHNEERTIAPITLTVYIEKCAYAVRLDSMCSVIAH